MALGRELVFDRLPAYDLENFCIGKSAYILDCDQR
jgi:hypothetical protein